MDEPVLQCQELSPAEFNPTVFHDEIGQGRWQIRVHCWSREIASVSFDPSSKPNRDWARVAHRWARMVISREFQRWREEADE